MRDKEVDDCTVTDRPNAAEAPVAAFHLRLVGLINLALSLGLAGLLWQNFPRWSFVVALGGLFVFISAIFVSLRLWPSLRLGHLHPPVKIAVKQMVSASLVLMICATAVATVYIFAWQSEFLAVIASFLFVASSFPSLAAARLGRWAQEYYITQRIEKIRGGVDVPPGLVAFACEQLTAATLEEERMGAKADRIANWLNRVGVSLTALSILAPVLAFLIYLNQSVDEANQGDWHLLVAGISFGFLVMAAGRGFLRQGGNERQVYFQSRRRVAYYGGLRSALKIAEKAGASEKRDLLRHVLEKVLETLLRVPTTETRSSPNSSPAERDSVLEILPHILRKD